jgi:quinol monooxygenase YgiN
MIVVTGRVQTDAERRAELIRIGHELVHASRAEDGCISYRLYADTEDENAFVFVEEWESLDILKRHFAEPHIATFMRAVPAVLTGPPEISFHEIARTYGIEDFS